MYFNLKLVFNFKLVFNRATVLTWQGVFGCSRSNTFLGLVYTHYSAGSRISQIGECSKPQRVVRQPIIWQSRCRQLRGNERMWPQKGTHVRSTLPLDPSMHHNYALSLVLDTILKFDKLVKGKCDHQYDFTPLRSSNRLKLVTAGTTIIFFWHHTYFNTSLF